MAALTADRNTVTRSGDKIYVSLAAGVTIFGGSLVALDSDGNLIPGDTTVGLVGAGRATIYADNSSGAAGDIWIDVDVGIFQWDNDGSITRDHIGDDAYIIDDQTVGATGSSVNGRIVDIDDSGVWVKNA